MANEKLKHGKLLIAEPFMVDPNFKRSVILLCEHEEEGSVGFILNKSLDMKINDLIEDFPDFKAPVYFGGPVQTDTIHYIHNVGDVLEDTQKVNNGVYWGGDFEKLKFLIKSGMVSEENIRFFIGYSGWSTGQLDQEMEHGSWLTTAMHSNYLFKNNIESLWKNVMNNKGKAYTVIAQMPDSAHQN